MLTDEARGALARAIAQALKDTGRPVAAGRVEVDPAELEGAVFALLGDKAPLVEDYDPVKHGQDMAKEQIGEGRTPDSLAWR